MRRKTYHVTRRSDGGWTVKFEGAKRASSVHRTKREATRRGVELARAYAPSSLIIHKRDGTIQQQHTYDAPLPRHSYDYAPARTAPSVGYSPGASEAEMLSEYLDTSAIDGITFEELRKM